MKNLTSLTKKDLLHLAEVYKITTTSKMLKQELIDLISPKHTSLSNSAKKTENISKSTTTKTIPLNKSTKKAKTTPTNKSIKKTETATKPSTLKITPVSKSTKEINNSSKSKTSNKIKHPVQDLKIYFDNTITVLPQSNESVLIIWNADPAGDEQIKAWKISNELGLDLLLPSYSRSLFINIAVLEKLDFHLYKIYQNNTQELFTEYNNDQISMYHGNKHSNINKDHQLLAEHLASIALSSLSSSSNNFSKLSSSSNNFRI